MKKIVFIVIILGVAIAILGFWQWQKNPYSKDILKLEILGPEETTVAEEIEYTVKYKNNGSILLEEPRLIFEFPENTLLEQSKALRQEIKSEDLGDIYPGEEKTFKFKGRLLGREGEIKTAKVWLSYQPKNLQARYESATILTTIIKSSPLTFDFDLVSKAEAARNFKFSLNYYSNINYPLTDLGIKISYPSGFEFVKSSPRALDKTEWDVPVLNKAEGGRIEIEGKLSGDVKEQKIFQAQFGVWLNDQFVLLKEINKAVEIVKPRLAVFQQINGQNNYIANPGDLLHYEIFFRNIGEDPFENLFLVVNLQGADFDFETIKTESGQFNKGDNSLVFDWRKISKLRFLGQGEESEVEFWINLKQDWEISSPQQKNAVLKNTVLVSQIREEFEIKVNSKLAVFQIAYYQDEIFGNSGPIPPKVGETTTYTIVWQAKNYFNDVKNVKIKAALPSDVRLTGKIFPESESSKFAFDNQSREIVWKVKDSEIMEAGTGVLNSPPNIAFQVAITPNYGQGNLIGEAIIAGEDQWTENIIEGKAEAISLSSIK